MYLTTHHRTLLRSWLGSAVIFAAVSACSRSDRTETGSTQDQTGAAMTVDTAAPADTAANPSDTAVSNADTAVQRQPVAQGTTDNAAQPSGVPSDTGVSGYQAMGQDTAAPVAEDTPSPEMAGAAGQPSGDTAQIAGDTVRVGDSTEIGKTGERLEPTASSEQDNADTTLTTQSESDRVRPPEDSTETVGAATTSDTAAMNSDTAAVEEMVRDTNTSVAQGDTIAEVQVDTTTQVADTATQLAADTGAAIQAQMDTTTTEQQTEVAVDTEADTTVVVGDSTEVGKTGERLEPNQASAEANADTLAVETERVRPPEDSSEVLGNVTTENEADQAPAAAAGAQTPGEMLTGAAAVAQLTREGQRCTVMEGEESEEDIRWDLAASPATMNPCGTGTMTLPRIQTGEQQ
jgi:hypothetical protein